MIQRIVICDRCGEKCNSCGTSYYTIDIYGHDINPTNDGKVYADTMCQNIYSNMKKINNTEHHFCRKCKEEIEEFMKYKEKI